MCVQTLLTSMYTSIRLNYLRFVAYVTFCMYLVHAICYCERTSYVYVLCEIYVRVYSTVVSLSSEYLYVIARAQRSRSVARAALSSNAAASPLPSGTFWRLRRPRLDEICAKVWAYAARK